MEKYIIATTWNGEGYSEASNAELKSFASDSEAEAYIWERFKADDCPNGDVNYWEFATTERQEDRTKIIFGNKKYDSGTWQYIKATPDVFGVIAQTNVNEVILCTEREYEDALRNAIDDSDPEDELDYDIAIGESRQFIATSEYDLQFVKLMK